MLREVTVVILVIMTVVGANDLVTLHRAVDPTDNGNRYIIAAEYNVPLATVEERIVNLKKNESLQIDVIWKIEIGLKFLFVEMNKAALEAVRELKADIAYIEQDCWLKLQADEAADQPPSARDGEATREMTKVAGVEVTRDQWGLDRIDQRNLPLDNIYSVDPNAGDKTSIYVIDTGVHAEHEDFGGRASNVYDFRGGDWNGRDCNGHGTILASVAAGTTYGVAKNASIYGMRVTSCTGRGRMSDSLKAMTWLVQQMKELSVALFGLSSPGVSPSIDNALHRLYTSGYVVVVPAGNNNSLACDFSPARGQGPITVGATTLPDYALFYNNYGKCVDLFAPGKSVVGAFYDGTKTGTDTKGGTSIAAGYVAGAAAYHLGNGMPMGKVKGYLIRHATEDQLHQMPDNTPNKLLYIGKVKTLDDYKRIVSLGKKKGKKPGKKGGKKEEKRDDGEKEKTSDAAENTTKPTKTEL